MITNTQKSIMFASITRAKSEISIANRLIRNLQYGHAEEAINNAMQELKEIRTILTEGAKEGE